MDSFAIVVVLLVALFCFSKPYILDYLREQMQTGPEPLADQL